VKKLRSRYDEARQQRDEALRQVETLGRRCALLGGYLDEAEAERRASEQAHQAELDRLTAALGEALEETESALEREAAHLARIRTLQAELARHRGEMAMALQPQSSEEDPG